MPGESFVQAVLCELNQRMARGKGLRAGGQGTSAGFHSVAWGLASYGIAAGCLFWVFRGLPWRQVLQSVERMNGWSSGVAALLDVLVYFCAAWEWQLLLRPLGRLSFWRTAQAIFAGRFANDALPVHAGYILRVYLMARWVRQPAAAVLPSLLVERFLDSLWLVASIGAAILFFPLPGAEVHTLEGVTGVIIAGAGVVAWVARRRKPLELWTPSRLRNWKPVRKLREVLQRLREGLHGIAASKLLPAAVSISILKLALQGLTFLVLLRGFGFTFSFWISVAVFLIAYVGLSLPSTPASVGVFQLFCVSGLRFFGVPKPQATGFALVSFVILTVPLSLCGFVAFAQSGLSLAQLRRQVADWKAPRRANPAPPDF